MAHRTLARFVRATVVALAAAGALGGTLVLEGCGQQPPSFTNLDITGNTQFGKDFALPDTSGKTRTLADFKGKVVVRALPDTSGKTRTLADFKGKVVVLFFGYTHCPDVCPTTMAELSQALQQLGPDAAKRVQVLFVSVDPERDTSQILSQYTAAFNPTFIGLRPASEDQLKQVAKDFRVYYAKVPGNTPDSYTMDHTAASYVFDTTGKLRLFARDGQGVTPWLHDLKILLGSNPD